MRSLQAFLLALGLVLAIAGPGIAPSFGAATAPFAGAVMVDMQPGGQDADPCSCTLLGSCSAPSLHAPEDQAAILGDPPHIVPRGGRIPSGLPPDIPSPPPRFV
jgi:hypothetical protein